jgi:iron(III) transport system permease protein
MRMTAWRVGTVLALLVLIGVPLAVPFFELAGESSAWQAWSESSRVAVLGWNTLRLIFGTLALCLPAGVLGAVLLYRTDLPLAGFWRFLTILALFVPLPLFASAWQATLGTGGLLPSAAWGTLLPDDPDVTAAGVGWKPWAYGIEAAIWVHAVAGLPWVILIVGQGLRWVDAELEEDALLAGSAGRVLRWVTLRQASAIIAVAGLWVALQTATEITITDMMQVRTFAEEVYYQSVLGDRAAVARGVAINLAPVLLVGLLVCWSARRVAAALPPLESRTREPHVFALGGLRLPALVLVMAAVLVLAGVPIASLVWKAGSVGSQPFSVEVVVHNVARVFLGKGQELIVRSLMFALLSGAVTALIGLTACWFLADAKHGWALLLLAALVLALPGPIIGIGLKGAIELVMKLEDAVAPYIGLGAGPPPPIEVPPPNQEDTSLQVREPSIRRPLRNALYDRPSALPLLWVTLIRFFPLTVAALWPVVRLFPAELRESAQLDGATPLQEFTRAALPLLAPVAFQAGLGVAVLSLGEVSASKLVETPGNQSFAHELFNQMHYGVQDRLAALCLVLLMVVTAGAATFALVSWALRRVGRA